MLFAEKTAGRTVRFNMICTPAEMTAMRKDARKRGLTVSNFVRLLLKHRHELVPVDALKERPAR